MDLMKEFFTINEQARLFLFSCLLGAPLGIIFDLFRISRRLIPHNKAVVHIEDIVFIFIWVILLVIYYTSFGMGQFRFIYVLGSGLGFVLYLVSTQGLFTKLLHR
ncbi:MAG: spore cortex biosynthesis protein YabQ [Ruminococcus sp.]|nr:spore cortex biosynthesis protein YabQ [Ruminococcus sp.]